MDVLRRRIPHNSGRLHLNSACHGSRYESYSTTLRNVSCSSSLVTNLGRVRNSLSGGNAESKNVLDGIAPVTLFLYSCSLIFQSTCGQLVHYLTLPPYLPPTGKLPSARVRLRKLLGGVHRARVNEITMWSILRNVILRRERHRGPTKPR